MENKEEKVSGGTKTAMDAQIERAKKMNEINHRCLNIHLNAMKTVQDNTFLCTRENMHQDILKIHPDQ